MWMCLFCSFSMFGLSFCFFFFSSRRRHTRSDRDWSSDVCSSDLLLNGCSSEPQSNPNLPNPGFTIITQRRNSLGIESPQPNTIVQGTQRRQLPPEATGTVRDFRGTSSPTVGLLPVPNGVAPAFWAIGEDNGPCAGQVAFGGVKRGDYNYLTC